MKPRPFKKNGRIVFWTAIFCVCAALSATVLLANDKRNLHMLFKRYQIEWPFDEPPKPAQAARKIKNNTGYQIELPEKFFAAQDPKIMGAFVRQVYIPGPALCALFDRIGIKNAGWKQSEFDRQTFECFSQRKNEAGNGPGNAASFFFMMKGTPRGVIRNIRMKLILPDGPDSETMKTELAGAMRILVEQTHWTDFNDAAHQIARLDNVESSSFGVTLTFAREFTDARRFNLIFSLAGRTAELQRTRSYFDLDRWLPLPPEMVTTPEMFLAPLPAKT